MRPRFARGALALAFGLATAGCVSSRAGLDTANAALHDRGGLALPTGDDDHAADATRAELLSSPLTPDSVARLALLGSPALRAELARLGIARADLARALALPNPQATASLRLHANGDVLVDFDATLDLTHLVLTPLREAAARHGLEAAALELAGAALDLAFEARLALYDFIAARQIHELRRTSAFATYQAAELMQRLNDAGNAPLLDTLNQRALYEEARLTVAAAESDELAARERLNLALGLSGADASSWTTALTLAEPPADELALADLEPRAIAASVELDALKARYGAAAAGSDAALAEGWVPDVAAGVSLEVDHGELAVGPQVSVSLPLFYHGEGESLRADAEMQRASAERDRVAIAIRSSARSLSARLTAARERALFFKTTLLPLRARIVDETLKAYNAMSASTFQLLTAKRDELETSRAYVEALREYWRARSSVEQLLAGGLPASTPAGPAPPSTQGAAAGSH